jgi:hypothetical protein
VKDDKCKLCGKQLCRADFLLAGAHVINPGMKERHELCGKCIDAEMEAGRLVQCINCGDMFETSLLNSQTLWNGEVYTVCPVCGHDVTTGETETEMEGVRDNVLGLDGFSLNGPWRNDACMGYTAMAMQRAGLDDKVINDVLIRMTRCFDDTSVEEAAKFLLGGSGNG